ncbi:MAG: hypothetical protein Q9M21_00660, partial [Mariprofundaceae bacterium]|nr:hypothetical protein [Mariprofundaceae bacterium]
AFTVGTGELNRWMNQAQDQQRAPSDHGKTIVRLKYISQVGSTPPRLKVFCNRPGSIKASYLRYLEQSFRKCFKLAGVPIRFTFTSSDNPYLSPDMGNKKEENPYASKRSKTKRAKPSKR